MSALERKMVAAWNRQVAVGTMVRYWRGVREGEPSGVGPTETSAEQTSSGTPVVFIKGTSGYIALSHVEVAEDGETYRPSRRPSVHPRHTKAWAIDQADPDTLRAAAHRLIAALQASQWQTAHAVGAHVGQCTPCSIALDAGEDLGCAEWAARQALVDDGWRAL